MGDSIIQDDKIDTSSSSNISLNQNIINLINTSITSSLDDENKTEEISATQNLSEPKKNDETNSTLQNLDKECPDETNSITTDNNLNLKVREVEIAQDAKDIESSYDSKKEIYLKTVENLDVKDLTAEDFNDASEITSNDKIEAEQMNDEIPLESLEINSFENGCIISNDDKQNDNSLSSNNEVVIQDKDSLYIVNNVILVEEQNNSNEENEIVEINDNIEIQLQNMSEEKEVTKAEIPTHVLGRNIINPASDHFRGGKLPPKPRLGVKVPYRNLTSQIVSKQEIENEIMKRQHQKNINAEAGSSNLFARKLTQRLAKKIIPSQNEQTSKTNNNQDVNRNNEETPKIDENLDLLAILEGDDTNSSEANPMDLKYVKDLEKQIALKQLSELPKTRKYTKRKNPDSDVISVTKQNENKSESQNEATNNSLEYCDEIARNETVKGKYQKEKKDVFKLKIETKLGANNTDEGKINDSAEQSKNLNEAPKFSSKSALKTYSRKRKSESDTENNPIASHKKPVAPSSSDVYVTKSSRVIKKKIIWDPDEVIVKQLPKITHKEKELPINIKKIKKSINVSVSREDDKPETKQEIKTTLSPKPKRLSEIDKLLMDEGAVKMLYAIKKTEEKHVSTNNVKNKSMSQEELLNQSNEIKNDLKQNSVKLQAISLRKKEKSTVLKNNNSPLKIPKKTSKDSNRSSLNSPPASPTPEASRIIRRHSSSSYTTDDDTETNETEGQKSGASKKRNSTCTIEEPKKLKRKHLQPNVPMKSVEIKLTDVFENNEGYTITKYEAFYHIELKPSSDSKVVFNCNVLKNLTASLEKINSDVNCKAVLLSSSGKSFCHGIDYKTLVADSMQERSTVAKNLSKAVREFLYKLASFQKILIAAVHGEVIGFGLLILIVFDLVIASDNSIFSTPYCSLDCIPEAMCLLSSSSLSKRSMVSEILLSSSKLSATDMQTMGLVSRVVPSKDFSKELMSSSRTVCALSAKYLEATKNMCRQFLNENINSKLSEEHDVLLKFWTNDNCQKKFKLYKCT